MEHLKPIEKVKGRLKVPSSKSYAQRAVAIACLSDGKVLLENLTDCDDVVAAKTIVEKLGAQTEKKQHDLLISKGIDFNANRDISINCGESGLSTRLFSAFSLLFDSVFYVTGEGSIQNRTMEMVIDALQQFGKSVESENNCLPLRISGKATEAEISIDGAVSSQLLTGLLIVTPLLSFNTTIQVKDLKSIPYVEMTLDILSDFGVQVSHEDFSTFKIEGNQCPKRSVYQVEGDWSGASFPIVAAAIGGVLELTGLNKNSKQADRAILEAVKLAGAKYFWKDETLIVEKANLSAFKFDATHCPDLFPPLAVLAAFAEGTSVIKGVSRLTHKESNRSLTIQEEFQKLGIEIKLKEDEMFISGSGKQKFKGGVTVDSRNDHRIAMALALFSLKSEGDIWIKNSEAVNKSYPDFFRDFSSITE